MNGQSNGTEIRLIQGYVVIEQEFDADGRAGRWRRMNITVPLHNDSGVNSSITMSVDFPANNKEAAEPWADVVQQMGGAARGDGDSDED